MRLTTARWHPSLRLPSLPSDPICFAAHFIRFQSYCATLSTELGGTRVPGRSYDPLRKHLIVYSCPWPEMGMLINPLDDCFLEGAEGADLGDTVPGVGSSWLTPNRFVSL